MVIQDAVRGRAIVVDLNDNLPLVIGPRGVDRTALGGGAPVSGNLPDPARLSMVVVPAEIEEAVAKLDAPEWATREAAAKELREGADVDESLMVVLSRPNLDAEQRHRLLDILCERLANAPRGALGIRMQFANDNRPGVVVVDTLPGMPAEKVLRADDRIMSIDGRTVFDGSWLQSLIMVERPGRVVKLEVDRPRRRPDGKELRGDDNEPVYERIVVDITLGSSDQLERFDQAAAMGLGGQMGGRLGGRFGGGGAMGGRVAALRDAQVREAIARFGPRPVDVAVANRRVPPPTDRDLDDIDEHPSVRSLMTYRRLIAEGAIRPTPALVESWAETLRSLRAQAEAPDVPEAIRAYLRAVSERYGELIPR